MKYNLPSKNKINKAFCDFNDSLKKVSSKVSKNLNTAPLISFLSLDELLKWSEKATKSAATIYDKAMDAEYLRSRIGGGNHRMFDGGHDLDGAWRAVKNASEDDTFIIEVKEYFEAVWKDLTTTKGLPFQTLEKADYNAIADWLVNLIPGVDKQWVYDLLSFDAFELFGSVLSVVGVVFALSKDDIEKLSEMLGAAGVISLLSANLIMGIAMTVVGAYAFFVKKKEFNKKEFTKGAILAITSTAIFGILGLPILIELIIVIVVCNILRNQMSKDIVVKDAIEKLFNSKIKGTLSQQST